MHCCVCNFSKDNGRPYFPVTQDGIHLEILCGVCYNWALRYGAKFNDDVTIVRKEDKYA